VGYSIVGFKNGECQLKGKSAFLGYDPEGVYTFYLYVWVIRGRGKTLLVDTGPKDLDKMNSMVKHILVSPIVQREGETTPEIIARAGISPQDVDYVLITHFHYDHCSNADLFPNAKIVVSKKGLEAATGSDKPTDADGEFIEFLRSVPRRVLAVDDGQILPGVATFWAGGHSISSQAYVVETEKGSVVFAGDSVFLYKNLELGVPIGVGRKPAERIWSMRRIQQAGDVVIPGHDPDILRRFPQGRIA